MKRSRWLALVAALSALGMLGCGMLGCGSSAPPAEEPSLTIEDDTESTPDDEPSEDNVVDNTPPELKEPSSDPAVTCMRVADRLGRCNAERAATALDDLDPEERSRAEAALAEAAAGIGRMRQLCQTTLGDADVAYIEQLGKCLALRCGALRECVGKAQ